MPGQEPPPRAGGVSLWPRGGAGTLASRGSPVCAPTTNPRVRGPQEPATQHLYCVSLCVAERGSLPILPTGVTETEPGGRRGSACTTTNARVSR